MTDQNASTPEPCFECGSTERIGTACKPCNPELRTGEMSADDKRRWRGLRRLSIWLKAQGKGLPKHPNFPDVCAAQETKVIKAMNWISELFDRIYAKDQAYRIVQAENEQLRLAICGGEDAPGYAAAQTLETILGVLESNYVLWRYETERAMDLAGHLTCILPMAKGYARDNPVGRNAEMIAEAEVLLGTEGRDDG